MRHLIVVTIAAWMLMAPALRAQQGGAPPPQQPHSDHTPKHGGQFFMAPDLFHHLEGTYPSERLFRLYLYDDYGQPLATERVRAVSGRLEIAGTVIPLVAARGRSYLEARLSPGSLPGRATAKVRFVNGGTEYRFDFAFNRLTRAPDPAPATPIAAASPPEAPRPATPAATTRNAPASASTAAPPQAAPTPPPTRAPAAVRAAPAAAATSAASAASVDAALDDLDVRLGVAPDPALVAVPIPEAMPDILAQLRVRDAQVRRLIEQGNLTAVFVPAFQARDLAIALESRLDTLDAEARQTATAAITRIVRTAWLLDAYGDVGDAEQLGHGYAVFTATIADLLAAFGDGR